jgi:hypothetical protein
VGCNVHTLDENNWIFSKSASPGIIYRPLMWPCGIPPRLSGRKRSFAFYDQIWAYDDRLRVVLEGYTPSLFRDRCDPY